MSPRTRKKTKAKGRQEIEVSQDAINILRSVKDQEAFYFYESVGKPAGEVAKSLSDFADKISNIGMESLRFHQERRDFQNWFEKTLGDSELAKRMEEIPLAKSEKTRKKIQTTVRRRIDELKDSSVAMVASTQIYA